MRVRSSGCRRRGHIMFKHLFLFRLLSLANESYWTKANEYISKLFVPFKIWHFINKFPNWNMYFRHRFFLRMPLLMQKIRAYKTSILLKQSPWTGCCWGLYSRRKEVTLFQEQEEPDQLKPKYLGSFGSCYQM